MEICLVQYSKNNSEEEEYEIKMQQKSNFKFRSLNILESNENNNEFIIKDYNEDLPKKLFLAKEKKILLKIIKIKKMN